MEVWSCCPAGLSDIADCFALIDAGAFAHARAESGEMGVKSGVLAVVLEYNGFPIAALGSDEVHAGIGCCSNGGSCWCGIINPLVCSPSFQYGVEASTEA